MSSVALQQDLPLQLKIRRRKIGGKKPPCLHWKDLWKRKTVTHLVFGLPVPPSIRPSCKTRPLCLSVNSSSTFLFFFFLFLLHGLQRSSRLGAESSRSGHQTCDSRATVKQSCFLSWLKLHHEQLRATLKTQSASN